MKKIALLLLVLVVGCAPETTVYPLPAPPAEVPVANPPVHQKNWLGPKGQGSCVYASLINHVNWLNMPEFARLIRSTRGDGEYASRLMTWLDQQNVPYVHTLNADPRFLDWCSVTRRGCILWWKPNHCCTFEGFAYGSEIMRVDPKARLEPGTQYAVILDNNYIYQYEYTPREQFVRLWAGYGGFGLTVLGDPATSIPFLSYEER